MGVFTLYIARACKLITPILHAIGQFDNNRVWLEERAVSLSWERLKPELLLEEVLCWHSEQIWLKVQKSDISVVDVAW